jgi:CBS domain-containing protein
MQVRDVMQHPATSCAPSAGLVDAAKLMQRDQIGSLPVIDERGQLVGIVTDRDIVLRGVAEGLSLDATVESVMSQNPVTVYGSDDAFAAATKMERHDCRRLPVVDHEGHLDGVISLDDLLVVFTEQIAKLAHANHHPRTRASG